MAIFNKFQPFVEDLAEKVHNLGADQLKIALCSVAPVNTNHLLTEITQIAYTNLPSTRNITTTSSTQTAGVYKLILADITLTATGGSVAPFRYVVLYNDTAASKNLIGYYDYGSALTLADTESLLIDFDAAAGVLTLT